jgi:hypothetical protein
VSNALKRQGCRVRMVVYPRTGHVPHEPKLLQDVIARMIEWKDRPPDQCQDCPVSRCAGVPHVVHLVQALNLAVPPGAAESVKGIISVFRGGRVDRAKARMLYRTYSV